MSSNAFAVTDAFEEGEANDNCPVIRRIVPYAPDSTKKILP